MVRQCKWSRARNSNVLEIDAKLSRSKEFSTKSRFYTTSECSTKIETLVKYCISIVKVSFLNCSFVNWITAGKRETRIWLVSDNEHYRRRIEGTFKLGWREISSSVVSRLTWQLRGLATDRRIKELESSENRTKDLRRGDTNVLTNILHSAVHCNFVLWRRKWFHLETQRLERSYFGLSTPKNALWLRLISFQSSQSSRHLGGFIFNKIP